MGTDAVAVVEDGLRMLLSLVGEDYRREGLLATPARFIAAMKEMTAGYDQDPADFLCRTFEDGRYDEMVVLRDIDFTSTCEHHLLPFTGVAHVGYLPAGGRVVGLSKLARLVDCYARRLQIQERMTAQIADAIQEHLLPGGVGVVVEASHQCMACRGVHKAGAVMSTSSMLGAMRDQPATRAEFLHAVRSA